MTDPVILPPCIEIFPWAITKALPMDAVLEREIVVAASTASELPLPLTIEDEFDIGTLLALITTFEFAAVTIWLGFDSFSCPPTYI